MTPGNFGQEPGYWYEQVSVNTRPLYYVRARWLGAGGPGWLSPDPLGLGGGDGNLYRYVKNRPTVGVDPSGMFSLVDLLVTVGTSSFLAATTPSGSAKPMPYLTVPGDGIPQCCNCTPSKTHSQAVVTDLTAAGQPEPPGICPKSQAELTAIGIICLADRSMTNLPDIPGAPPHNVPQNVPMDQAFTTCCKKQSSKTTWYLTGCTSFLPAFFDLPGVYQRCLWQHELRRRWGCYWHGPALGTGPVPTYDSSGSLVSEPQDHLDTLRCVFDTLRGSCGITDQTVGGATVLQYCNPDQ